MCEQTNALLKMNLVFRAEFTYCSLFIHIHVYLIVIYVRKVQIVQAQTKVECLTHVISVSLYETSHYPFNHSII